MSNDTPQNIAGSLIQRAIELDNNKRYTEAIVCYQEGLQLLMNCIKTENGTRKTYLRQKFEEYMNRAETIKSIIAKLKDEEKYHEQINIEDNATGYSYSVIFKRFLDSDVSDIKIEDPYIRAFHQCQNLVRFVELVVKECKNLKNIFLVTVQVSNSEQTNCLEELRENLITYKIQFNISYSTTLHDRQIILSNGWIIKIGRGLDFYKRLSSKFSLGNFDFEFRPCHETTVDIFHSKNIMNMLK